MNYKKFVEHQRKRSTSPMMEDPNYFKGTISPPVSTLADGGKIVYLYDEIDEQSINRVISEILPLIGTGENLQLRIKSYGGSLYDCLALIEIIRQYDIPVHVDGYAMSGAFLLFAAAKVRTMSPYSWLMYHDMTYFEFGKRATHRNQLQHSDNLSKQYHDLICEYTKITPKMLKEWDEKQTEWYIDYDEAVKLLVVNQVLQEVEIEIPAREAETHTQLTYVEVTDDKKTTKAKPKQ